MLDNSHDKGHDKGLKSMCLSSSAFLNDSLAKILHFFVFVVNHLRDVVRVWTSVCVL